MSHMIVTGGAGALGTAVVSLLRARDHTVHVPALEPEGDGALADWPHHGDDGVRLSHEVDLTDADAVTAFYDSVPNLQASIHIAGGFRWAPIAETSLETFRFMMDINAVTCFLCCQQAARRLGEGGRIVNVAARPVAYPTAGVSAYAASKAAVASLTRTLSEELREQGIGVNAVMPSIIDTEANRQAMPDADHDSWPSPAAIAQTIAFLASADSAVTSGAIVPVFGATG